MSDMGLELPDDILQLICDALLAQRDFATLFNCAVSSRRLAKCALSDIYRIYNEAADDDDEPEGIQNAQMELGVYRGAVKWRSIVLSALDQTLFPYYRYIRMLDLRGLESLLGDTRFHGKVEKVFFEGSMSRFKREREIPFKRQRKVQTRKVVEPALVVEAIGDAIIPKTDTLEQISGQFVADSLQRWVPHLPRLQRLELWIGRALVGEGIRRAIYEHCPHFTALSVGHWIDPYTRAMTDYDEAEPDKQLGAFLTGLPQNSLTVFENIWPCELYEHFFPALACHAASLKELRLCIERLAIRKLPLLRDCTNLERVRFEINGSNVTLDMVKPETLHDITAWLRDCKRLRSIEFHEASFAPAILTPVLQDPSVRLKELIVQSQKWWYEMKDNRAFHQAFAQQKSLETLSIHGDATEVISDDNDALVASVAQCTALKHLNLRGASEYFSESLFITLLTSLPLLEDVYIQGLNLGDAVLEAVADHQHLKSICFMDLTSFSFEGLLGFVQRLDPGRKMGFELSINNASNETLLSEEEQQVVRMALVEKVKGRLDYQSFRDADASDVSLYSD